MKVFPVLLLFILPFPVFAKKHFKGIKKEVNIIHSKTGIIERPNQQYFISGDVLLKIWGGTYYCDSALFKYQKKELDVYGISRQTDGYLHIWSMDHCPNIILFPTQSSELSTCSIR